ncbi:MAG: DegT/DnrJ/EryC1/StrS family aminotransferase [Nanoarchaeota archaeon]|nr:DegT/DnrJ/EryC1/StrS family aminotransferase [Nanoarchaeota archaeon]
MIPIARPFIGDEEIQAVTDVLKSGMIAQDGRVSEIEEEFARLCGTKYAVAVNSGTAALHTALKIAGIKKGDEVITTPFTFIATANTILMQGAKPVFADVIGDTFNIDPKKIKEKVTSKTKAIVAVDLYGHLCDYDEIGRIAEKNKLIVVEDACQSINAEYKGKKAGSFGSISAFSFYATKNITCGEGGILTTENKDYAENARLFRQHGRSNLSAYDYSDVGYNYRMTDISASILLVQLKKLDFVTKKRIENADCLNKGLGKIKGIKVPIAKKGYKHVFHQYTLRVEDNFKLNRDELMSRLNKKGIGCGIYYPKPLHLCQHIKKLGYKEGDFPVAEKLSKQVLSLPIHPNVTKEQLRYIIDTFLEIK